MSKIFSIVPFTCYLKHLFLIYNFFFILWLCHHEHDSKLVIYVRSRFYADWCRIICVCLDLKDFVLTIITCQGRQITQNLVIQTKKDMHFKTFVLESMLFQKHVWLLKEVKYENFKKIIWYHVVFQPYRQAFTLEVIIFDKHKVQGLMELSTDSSDVTKCVLCNRKIYSKKRELVQKVFCEVDDNKLTRF